VRRHRRNMAKVICDGFSAAAKCIKIRARRPPQCPPHAQAAK